MNILLDSALKTFTQRKTQMSLSITLFHSIIAGIFISLGGLLFALMVNFSFTPGFKLVGSSLFSLGLILILIFRSQLFTGNNLFLYAFFSKDISLRKMLKNWVIVFIGNLLGALFFALLLTSLTSYFFWDSQLIETFYKIAQIKINYPTDSLLYKSIYCNILVCLAVLFYLIAKKTILKLIGVIIPITLFVFMGFEHSIANMFFLGTDLFFNIQGSGAIHLNALKIFFIDNLLIVTLGNIIGAGILSAALYFFTQKQRKNQEKSLL